MRQSNPFVKPLEDTKDKQPWLYWEPFDTDRIEMTIDYHYECYKREYKRWKNNLIEASRTRARWHLQALQTLTKMLKSEIYEQRRQTPRDMKQRLEDPDYGYEEEEK